MNVQVSLETFFIAILIFYGTKLQYIQTIFVTKEVNFSFKFNDIVGSPLKAI